MPAPRPDVITVETDSGRFEHFNSIELVRDLFDTSQATLEIGDDGAWREIERIVQPGAVFRVYCNGLLQLTGRAEVNEVPATAEGGAIVQVVVRTKMADARYASADPKVRFANTSIKDFILALYAPLGYGPEDFVFAPATDRDLATGKKKGAEDPVDLEPLKAEQAKVNPPETIHDAAKRTLERHHLMHWDGADGRILVGAPDGTQSPSARILCKRGAAGAANNVTSVRRIIDWGEVPSEVWAFGGTTPKDLLRASVRGVAVDLDLLAVAASSGHFRRKVLIPAEGAKTAAMAAGRARLEMAARSKRKDAWEAEADRWSYWDGHSAVPYYINTTADLDVEIVGGKANGLYLVSKVTQTLSAEAGPSARIELVHPSILEL